MAFGERKIRFVSPTCENDKCHGPEYLHGLCWPHWAAQTGLERALRKLDYPDERPQTDMSEFEAMI